VPDRVAGGRVRKRRPTEKGTRNDQAACMLIIKSSEGRKTDQEKKGEVRDSRTGKKKTCREGGSTSGEDIVSWFCGENLHMVKKRFQTSRGTENPIDKPAKGGVDDST